MSNVFVLPLLYKEFLRKPDPIAAGDCEHRTLGKATMDRSIGIGNLPVFYLVEVASIQTIQLSSVGDWWRHQTNPSSLSLSTSSTSAQRCSTWFVLLTNRSLTTALSL